MQFVKFVVHHVNSLQHENKCCTINDFISKNKTNKQNNSYLNLIWQELPMLGQSLAYQTIPL